MNEQQGSRRRRSKKFEEVDRQHPYSDWARKSLLMSAYAYYQAGDYDSCIGAATRYVTLHPGSPDAAYAQYLIAASHYDQIPDITPRPGPHREGDRRARRGGPQISDLRICRRRQGARSKVARDQLAGKEMDVGRYYMEKRDYTGGDQPLQDRGRRSTRPRAMSRRRWRA